MTTMVEILPTWGKLALNNLVTYSVGKLLVYNARNRPERVTY